MKKKLLLVLSMLVISGMFCNMQAKETSSDLTKAIKMYKAGNYSECYTTLNDIIEKDSANALAYYYLAISSVQVGKKEEALANYEKAILLSPKYTNLNRYATKGKTCIESPNKCEDAMFESSVDAFIQSKKGARLSDEVKGELERLRIENLMREINRSGDIEPQKFKEYKDFSSMNDTVKPTNDDIVAALRVLQNAGLSNYANNINDISLLTSNGQQDSLLNMLGNSSLNPQIIQAMLTNKMTLGF